MGSTDVNQTISRDRRTQLIWEAPRINAGRPHVLKIVRIFLHRTPRGQIFSNRWSGKATKAGYSSHRLKMSELYLQVPFVFAAHTHTNIPTDQLSFGSVFSRFTTRLRLCSAIFEFSRWTMDFSIKCSMIYVCLSVILGTFKLHNNQVPPQCSAGFGVHFQLS